MDIEFEKFGKGAFQRFFQTTGLTLEPYEKFVIQHNFVEMYVKMYKIWYVHGYRDGSADHTVFNPTLIVGDVLVGYTPGSEPENYGQKSGESIGAMDGYTRGFFSGSSKIHKIVEKFEIESQLIN